MHSLPQKNTFFVDVRHCLYASASRSLLMLLAFMCERHKLQSASLTEVSNPNTHIQASFKLKLFTCLLNMCIIEKTLCINTIRQKDHVFVKNAVWWFFFDTYSLCTKWFRRSCVMSSCQLFLMPVAEGGPAVGMEPTPLASFIRLEEIGGHHFND